MCRWAGNDCMIVSFEVIAGIGTRVERRDEHLVRKPWFNDVGRAPIDEISLISLLQVVRQIGQPIIGLS